MKVTAMILGSLLSVATVMAAETDDPYQWLEDLKGTKVMEWVEAENARTLAVLKNDPNYESFYQQALAIAAATDRIPVPILIAGKVFNLWRDAGHPQGILRFADEADYARPDPKWTTVLDLDALSKAEGKTWVWKRMTCLLPEERFCLISLSEGGEDAVTLREFDLVAGHFVENGFVLPTSKQGADWVDKDTLLVSRDWGPGTMTASGYPYVAKTVKRGQPLSAAREVFRGRPEDVSASGYVLEDGDGNHALFGNRNMTFFERETSLLTPQGAIRLPLPVKLSVRGMLKGRVVIQTSEEWKAGGMTIPAGALASVTLADIRNGGDLSPTLIFAPDARQSVYDTAVTKSTLTVLISDNVRARARVYTPVGKAWTSLPLSLTDNATIDIASTSTESDRVYFTVAGFLDPTTLWSMDAIHPSPLQIKTLPARFNATGHVVEQFEATSSDGTKIPYFVVHRKDIALDGNTPALMTAYGGFEVSETPYYSSVTGKLWLERGGSFVLANIRGGGEFGPAWHEAGRKTRRQIIYDDFAAVAKDIFARKLSSPARFGIYGGSNGGLLMGVEFNQHPDLWKAVVIQVPLLDMIRYEQIQAGASWVDEYGSVSVPEEKAFLQRISPYANIRRDVAYPEPYIWTTTKDDRVGPQHARKFAARLKEYGLPYLFYEDTAGGHSGDADVEQGARLKALEMVYFTRQLVDQPQRR